ncbi:hypothetical protein BX616_004710 [Lobosporangium transversale]|uniref:Uncharacterized protein n=1 Tax=Lobosporangium transversale TaxID=64571 RepID=A0A1Y2GT55_9FUNG|nr:hypothetical protein BCR41DRAFT_350316 [Lobosporangium transversale]KAF9897952.1 hypothetical protein BX616_004710 [Lobosporangium transversale]ORZ21970.1 hypothetical protein BCR41DRAFT_350316 [Lobosporangium transversale]|eukprot:XP_021883221.1 hypothetical protein BCR41DRAFT_350316 [Lobosporangium transversale]
MPIPVSPHFIPGAEDMSVLSATVRARSSAQSTTRKTESITLFLPIAITALFLLILAITGLLARCLHRRFKDMRISSSTSSNSWKSYYSSRSDINSSHYQDDSMNFNGDDREQEALLARRRSTSYYDANRSRAPVAVVGHDPKGRPISTWSTASSVVAARGEELSKWSQRRDDLIKIYGRSNLNSSSCVNMQGLEEEERQGLTEQGIAGLSLLAQEPRESERDHGNGQDHSQGNNSVHFRHEHGHSNNLEVPKIVMHGPPN